MTTQPDYTPQAPAATDAAREVSEADIEAAARFFANAYVRGHRGAFADQEWTLTVDEWVGANWQSFCTEATEHLSRLARHAAQETQETRELREDKARNEQRWKLLESALFQLRHFGYSIKGGSPNELRNRVDAELTAAMKGAGR